MSSLLHYRVTSTLSSPQTDLYITTQTLARENHCLRTALMWSKRNVNFLPYICRAVICYDIVKFYDGLFKEWKCKYALRDIGGTCKLIAHVLLLCYLPTKQVSTHNKPLMNIKHSQKHIYRNVCIISLEIPAKYMSVCKYITTVIQITTYTYVPYINIKLCK